MDLEILRQFGRPAFAYSGAQPQLLPVVEKARTVDLYDGRVGGYFRDPRRVAPHNLYAHTAQLLAEAPSASKGQAYAIHWSRPDAEGGTTFTTTSGQAMTFARGPVWIVLATTP